LGISQTKRQQGIDFTVSAGAQGLATLNTAADPCNIHGLILDLWVGSEVTGQHDFGHWSVVLQPREDTSAPSMTTSGISAEDANAIFWMLGTWMLIGPDKVHIGGAPRTSRNCPRGGRLRVLVENSVLSAGAMRVHGNASWFETIK